MSEESSVTVLLIRHARSVANAEGVLAGRLPGIELDETGHLQAEQLADALAPLPLEFVVHSDLVRTQQTVAPLLRRTGIQAFQDSALTECDYGSWSGRKLSELSQEELWQDIQVRPSTVRFPEGEAMLDMQHRAVRAVSHWADEAASLFAICSHGDVIKAIVADCIGLCLDSFQSLHVSPASLTVVRRTSGAWSLLTLNQSLGENFIGGLALAAKPTLGGGDIHA